jgi:hypothetical protein
MTGTMFDQATSLALRSEDYWGPWASAVDAALGGDATDLWALGEKEFFDLDRAVFYRSFCADINLPADAQAYGIAQSPLLLSYTSALAPCAGYPRVALPPPPSERPADVFLFASPSDPLTPSTLLDSAPQLSGMGRLCRTNVVGHTNLRDPVQGPLELGFVTGTAPGPPC